MSLPGIGADTHVIARRFVHDNIQRFGQRHTIFRRVNQFGGKVVQRLHIDAGHRGGGLHIGGVQHAGRVPTVVSSPWLSSAIMI